MLYAWCRHCDDVVDDQILGFARRSPIGGIDAEARLAELIGEAFEHAPGRAIVRRDRRLDALDLFATFAVEQLGDEAPGQLATAGGFGDGDLPHEERAGILRRNIGRDPSEDLTVFLGQHAGLGEVGALQEVAVERISVQRLAGRNQIMHGLTVFPPGVAEPQPILRAACRTSGVVRRLLQHQCASWSVSLPEKFQSSKE